MCGFDRCLMAVAGVLIAAGLPLMLSRIEVGEVLLFAAVFVAIWVSNRRSLARNNQLGEEIGAQLGSHDDRMTDVAADARRMIGDIESMMRDTLSLEIDQTGMLHRAIVGRGSGPQRIHHRN